MCIYMHYVIPPAKVTNSGIIITFKIHGGYVVIIIKIKKHLFICCCQDYEDAHGIILPIAIHNACSMTCRSGHLKGYCGVATLFQGSEQLSPFCHSTVILTPQPG